MTAYEKEIIDSFIKRYSLKSKKDRGESGDLRLRSVSIFPGFDTATADKKESYLEAAESLERQGLLTLHWEKQCRGERLKTLYCSEIDKLYTAIGQKPPDAAAEEIQQMIRSRLSILEEKFALQNGALLQDKEAAAVVFFLRYLAERCDYAEMGRGMDSQAAADMLQFMDYIVAGGEREHITTRALSIRLFRNSKRLETIIDLVNPFLVQAQKEHIPVPDISSLERSFPETLIAGKLIFEYKTGTAPLVNEAGIILGFPAESVRAMLRISAMKQKKSPKVLCIENKETFYALSKARNHPYDSLLYTGGYSNKAVTALIKLLAGSQFIFFHAGDLDPSGILILQHISDTAGVPVTPLRMDGATFDRYDTWSRSLTPTMLRQLEQIRDDTRSLPGIAGLIQRIEQSRCGIEQEIIDYSE